MSSCAVSTRQVALICALHTHLHYKWQPAGAQVSKRLPDYHMTLREQWDGPLGSAPVDEEDSTR